jgi:hypothetical protein
LLWLKRGRWTWTMMTRESESWLPTATVPHNCKITCNRRAFVDRHHDKNLGHTPYHPIPELCTNKAISETFRYLQARPKASWARTWLKRQETCPKAYESYFRTPYSQPTGTFMVRNFRCSQMSHSINLSTIICRLRQRSFAC